MGFVARRVSAMKPFGDRMAQVSEKSLNTGEHRVAQRQSL
jgi:hypothetical protein